MVLLLMGLRLPCGCSITDSVNVTPLMVRRSISANAYLLSKPKCPLKTITEVKTTQTAFIRTKLHLSVAWSNVISSLCDEQVL